MAVELDAIEGERSTGRLFVACTELSLLLFRRSFSSSRDHVEARVGSAVFLFRRGRVKLCAMW
jgi:hypothetical protein